MTPTEREQIIALIKHEVVPAIGCTEPMAVALAVAKSKEILGSVPSKIEVFLSSNMLKNAMGVGIPATGMVGLPIAIALGALVGKSEYLLEVLKDTTPESVEEGKIFINEKRIQISQKKGDIDKLYIEVISYDTEQNNVKVIISGDHTHFSLIKKNDQTLLNDQHKKQGATSNEGPKLSMEMVYDFATNTPIDDIKFILDSATLNKNAAEVSLHGEYGHSLGKTILLQSKEQLFGNGLYAKILAYTSAACDARMAGLKIPVMSNSGSGNQGIAATLPVFVYAKERLKSEEELIRALTLSHLTVIYIKQSFGRLSPLCGCVVAATGSACGITYLMGGSYTQIVYAVKNMIANITGMICDGAKPSCSLKVATGVSTAILSAMLAIDNKTVSCVEGIIDNDIEQCVKNMANLGLIGMEKTDQFVLDIMTQKQSHA
ncbi:MAG: L-serine ammonia-lyase, iron-sulfur-dependent, subunit alpha [Bacteroidales bacterium]|nr:L-serine ammonia-lyase, iron-sulfur-dependent, subunit alpha [Bacteroidales bacterium]